MTSYHISSSNTVAVCHAEPGKCPLKSAHFQKQSTAQLETERRSLSLGELPRGNENPEQPSATVTAQALLWASYDLTEPTPDELVAYIIGFNSGLQANIAKKQIELPNEENVRPIAIKGFDRVCEIFRRTEHDFPQSTYITKMPDKPSLKAELVKDEVIEVPKDYPKFKVENKNGLLKTSIVNTAITGLVYRTTEGKYEQNNSTQEFRYTLPRAFLQDSLGIKYIVEIKPTLYKANGLPLVEVPPLVHRIR